MWFWVFILSAIGNVFLTVYIRWLLLNISSINEENLTINEEILKFTEHVKSIHELEMFYGDETLQSLVEHGKALCDSLSELDLILNDKTESPPEENIRKGPN